MDPALGRTGEQLITEHVARLHWIILEKNLHSRFGEIDLIAQDGGEIVFIEVKTRKNLAYGYPQEAVNVFKLQKMMKTAQLYLLDKKWEHRPHRFDVFTVTAADGKMLIEHFKHVG